MPIANHMIQFPSWLSHLFVYSLHNVLIKLMNILGYKTPGGKSINLGQRECFIRHVMKWTVIYLTWNRDDKPKLETPRSWLVKLYVLLLLKSKRQDGNRESLWDAVANLLICTTIRSTLMIFTHYCDWNKEKIIQHTQTQKNFRRKWDCSVSAKHNIYFMMLRILTTGERYAQLPMTIFH